MSSLLLAGIIAGLVVSVPLGPVGVIIIRKTLHNGRWSGYVSGAGATLADTFFAIIAGFGISIITDFIQMYQAQIRVLGGAILMFLAYKIFMSNVITQVRNRGKKSSLWSNFMQSYFLTLSNPLTIIAIGAVFATGGPGKDAAQVEIMTLITGVFVGAVSWWFILVTLVNLFRRYIRLKTLWYINKVTGIIILLFALFVISTAFGLFPNLLN